MKIIKLIVKIGVAFIAFLIVLAAFMPKSESRRSRRPYRRRPAWKLQVTMENFNSIDTGMTYKQVSTVLGPGTEMSRSDLTGFETVMYSWQSSGIGK
jgi:hypothetical protein